MQGINKPNVSSWLDANIDELNGPYEFELLAGGKSNLTFKGTDASGNDFVLRRPPLGHVLATAHDMVREHKIISAVGPTTVPVARTMGVCHDPEVNDSPFYIMSLVEGIVLDGPDIARDLPADTKLQLSHNLVDVLADLHNQDIDEIGLGDLAKRAGYVERQLKRWSRQWEASKTREIPEVEEVERRLRLNIPVQQREVVAHGDYRFGNCLVNTETAKIEGVLDWELCTLGDPVADLGYLGVWWADPTAEQPGTDPSWFGDGWPSYAELVERYAISSGLDVSNVGYYVAFSSWRLAIISEGVYARYAAGVMGDQEVDLELLGQGTILRARAALEALDS